MIDYEKVYIDFAAKISFFEFIQEEFKSSNLEIKTFNDELTALKERKHWNIDNLSSYIREYPRSFLVFQEIVQLIRFTNAQYIHFTFDVGRLNSINLESIFEYMIFNIKYDEEFKKVFLKLIDRKLSYRIFVENLDKYEKKYLIAIFKQAISKYIDRAVKNFLILEQRIERKEFVDFSVRFSNYLLRNYRINDVLNSVDLAKFLKNKRIPIDTKKIHGNYPKIRLIKMLEKSGYTNIDSALNKNSISILKHDIRGQIDGETFKSKKLFCTEKYVEGLVKPSDRKLKKFDLIIFSKLCPKYLFEINFYSTGGTKIGINQDEYVALYRHIEQNFDKFKFYWITDGNYWLTQQGKNRFLNLLNYFKKIYNINLFAENISCFK